MIGLTVIDRHSVNVTPIKTVEHQQVSIGHDVYEIITEKYPHTGDCICGANDHTCVCFEQRFAKLVHRDGTLKECNKQLTEYVHSVAWERENIDPDGQMELPF